MRMRDKENLLKLDILQSLASSQKSLAKMIASIADVTEKSEHTAHHIAANIEVIAKYQRSLADKIGQTTVKRIRSGVNAKPWLNDGVKIRLRKVKKRHG